MANISPSIVTRNVADFAKETGNVYQSVAIISKRANQISVKIKEELSNKLAEFATTVDNLEEVFENREQIEISKYYERLPKATNLAIEEFMEGKVMFRTPDEEEIEG
ncbi:DNA-directed RNA polymerase subunit omega [soil metagenome]|jgi:DNA-directed RNA polymerase subunit K/omega